MFDATPTSEHAHSRRSYLKATGGALAGFTLSGTATARTSQYDTVVDVVEAGADPTGSEPIDDVLEEYNEDNTRIEFPDGRYSINKLSLYKRTNFAMVGTGDATLVPGPDHADDNWISGGFVRNLRFENFTLDHTAADTHPSVGFGGFDGIVVRNVQKKGLHDGNNTAFGFSAWEEDGHVLVENLEAPDGGIPETAVGVYVDTEGTVTFRDCHVEGFGNNGLYASSSDGPVHVEGGVYKNNDIAQVRLGSPGSYVRGATITVDDPDPEHDNSRGVRISDGHGPVTIENCDIQMMNGEGGGGVVGAFSGGGFTLRDSRIYVDPEYTTVGSGGTKTAHGVLVDVPSGIDDPGPNTIENTAITGGGSNCAAVCLRRGNTTLRDVCIHQTGTNRDGVTVESGASSNRIENSNVNVTGTTIANDDGDVAVDGLSVSEACPFPSGVEKTTSSQPQEKTVLADAPIPDYSSRLTYPTMGFGDDVPTADVFFGFATPQDDQAALMALPRVLNDLVAAGELEVRYRPYGLEDDRSQRLAGMMHGVWDHEWSKFWEVFGWAYENHEAYDLDSYVACRDFLEAAGVRNYALIAAYAWGDEYADALEQSADEASSTGIPGTIPCIEMDGDFTWFDRNDPPERDALIEWIEENQ